jgi:hypothetical protein
MGTVALSDHLVRLLLLRGSRRQIIGTVEWFEPFLVPFHEQGLRFAGLPGAVRLNATVPAVLPRLPDGGACSTGVDGPAAPSVAK